MLSGSGRSGATLPLSLRLLQKSPGAWLGLPTQHCVGKEEGTKRKTGLFQGIDSDKDGYGLEAGDSRGRGEGKPWTGRRRRSVEGDNGREAPGHWRTSFCCLTPEGFQYRAFGDLKELGEERRGKHQGGKELVQRCPAMAYGKDLTWAAPSSQDCVFRDTELGRLLGSSQEPKSNLWTLLTKVAQEAKKRTWPLRGWSLLN